ncbi:MAG: FtsX-like permease family protein [Epulopiscium sp.]|nr:FtsX-like permease family protein [Candidatus Epulonipiscium sp.]
MNLIESVKSAFRSVFSNKMRSFLTMLGIIIGISSVIMITSVGQGSQVALTGEFDKLGVNMLTISLKDPSKATSRDQLTMEDIEIIKNHPQVTSVTPLYQGGNAQIQLRNPKEYRSSILIGVNESYKDISALDFLYGRFLIDTDVKMKSKVAIIDDGLAKEIFGYDDVIGQQVYVQVKQVKHPFTVIGVIKNPMGDFASLFPDQIPAMLYMPIGAVHDLYGTNQIQNFAVAIQDKDRINDTSLELTKMLEKKHRNENQYYVQSATESLDVINKVLGYFTAFISFVAGISLLVGGIGVMNIMLVTVTERTREIGIRKSLGAKNKDIRIQFLIEAMILTIIGGLIGIGFGYLGGLGIGSLMKITPKVSLVVVLLTVTLSSMIGIIFGVYPANKAAKLDPIEALRYE